MPKPSAFSLIYHADDTAILLDSIQNFRVADFCFWILSMNVHSLRTPGGCRKFRSI